jgi:hypothetical protein
LGWAILKNEPNLGFRWIRDDVLVVSWQEVMAKRQRDPIREDRIHEEAIGDWHYWLPFVKRNYGA